MKRKDIDRLVSVAESAKSCGGYHVADQVISVLFAEAEAGNKSVVFVCEVTNDVDETLEHAFAAAIDAPDIAGYYTIAWIGCKENMTCIPLPMLSAKAIDVLRNGKPTLIERMNHDRSVEVDEAMQASLLVDLHQLVSAERIAECVEMYILPSRSEEER